MVLEADQTEGQKFCFFFPTVESLLSSVEKQPGCWEHMTYSRDVTRLSVFLTVKSLLFKRHFL